MLTTILLPLDGSPLAERALPYAETLARAAGARLILLRVPAPTSYLGSGAEAWFAVRQRAESEVGALAERLRVGGLEVEPALCYDLAATAVTDAARRRGADLIVLATHGRSGAERWRRGSVTDQVVRRADSPVLVIPPGCERPWPTDLGDRPLRILVPLDGSELAEEALGPAGKLAALLGAPILLLSVVEPARSGHGEQSRHAELATVREPAVGFLDQVGDSGRQGLVAARDYLEAVAGDLRAGGHTVEVRTVGGSPTAEIARAADERDVDAIVMATHGRGGLVRLVLGSVATGALQRARVPVLLVRPNAARASRGESSSTSPPTPPEPGARPRSRINKYRFGI